MLLGWAFKKDTNDSRESAAIYVANNIINIANTSLVFDVWLFDDDCAKI